MTSILVRQSSQLHGSSIIMITLDPFAMLQSMTLQFTPHQQDYASVLRLFNWQRTSTKISLAVLVSAFGLLLFVILTSQSPVTPFEIIWLFIPPLFLVTTFYLQPIRLAKKAVQNEQLAAEVTWVLNDSGVKIVNRYGTDFFEWDTFNKLVIHKNYYLLFSKGNKNAFRFIPRRAFTSQQEEALFLQLVTQHLTKE